MKSLHFLTWFLYTFRDCVLLIQITRDPCHQCKETIFSVINLEYLRLFEYCQLFGYLTCRLCTLCIIQLVRLWHLLVIKTQAVGYLVKENLSVTCLTLKQGHANLGRTDQNNYFISFHFTKVDKLSEYCLPMVVMALHRLVSDHTLYRRKFEQMHRKGKSNNSLLIFISRNCVNDIIGELVEYL